MKRHKHPPRWDGLATHRRRVQRLRTIAQAMALSPPTMAADQVVRSALAGDYTVQEFTALWDTYSETEQRESVEDIDLHRWPAELRHVPEDLGIVSRYPEDYDGRREDAAYDRLEMSREKDEL